MVKHPFRSTREFLFGSVYPGRELTMSIAPGDRLPVVESPALVAHREALRKWLAWHEREQHLTEQMFQSRHDLAKLEQLRDECDRLRQAAVEASQALLAAESRRPR